jgi:hypothetical protein
VGEVLAAILHRFSQATAIADEQLTAFAKLDPDVVRWLGADDWIEPAQLLSVVGERA